MTQTTKPLPGPYEAWPVKGDRLNRWMVVCVNPQRCPGTGKEVVAKGIRTEATARRLAAAPELLEALESLNAVGYLSSSSCASKEGSAALAKARAALAKAGVTL